MGTQQLLEERYSEPFTEGPLREQNQHIYLHGPGIDEPLEVEHDDGQLWLYHADALGSIVRVTSATGAEISAMRRQYDAFGNLQEGTLNQGFAFTGREWDPETGLYYYRARYYDPGLGRFISEDPITFQGGINFFLYVNGNPVNRADPSGLVIVNRSPTALHMDPAAVVGPHCKGHLGCTETSVEILHRCYQQGGCWRVEITANMSIDAWVSNDLLFKGKTAEVLAHELGHVAVSEEWFDQVVADARTMESYEFCSKNECDRMSELFERAWLAKLWLRQTVYQVLN